MQTFEFNSNLLSFTELVVCFVIYYIAVVDMKAWKVFQRQLYDILSHKFYLLLSVLLLTTSLVAILHIFEVWISSAWTNRFPAQYFYDNIGRESFQKRLCQHLPIDVVYTWVNGSDPLLQSQMRKSRAAMMKELSRACPYRDCFPSHITAFRHFKSAVETSADGHQWTAVVNAASQSWVLVGWDSAESAARAVESDVRWYGRNVTVSQAHWTTDAAIQNVYSPNDTLVVRLLANNSRRAMLKRDSIEQCLKHPLKLFWDFGNTVVVQLHSVSEAALVIQNVSWRILKLEKRLRVNVTRAYLILELPSTVPLSEFASSRFEDNEELRYSLRSLERHAPWIRHVYLVTNGQLPHWLDTANPRISLVTHDAIFTNLSHLPTFSSPAIETHLHRIPGISKKFLYMNDDILLGQAISPEDFISPTDGQKVYLTWPVPDCTPLCPWSWVSDGSCDLPCNITECSFDGGDCMESSDMRSNGAAKDVAEEEKGSARWKRDTTDRLTGKPGLTSRKDKLSILKLHIRGRRDGTAFTESVPDDVQGNYDLKQLVVNISFLSELNNVDAMSKNDLGELKYDGYYTSSQLRSVSKSVKRVSEGDRTDSVKIFNLQFKSNVKSNLGNHSNAQNRKSRSLDDYAVDSYDNTTPRLLGRMELMQDLSFNEEGRSDGEMKENLTLQQEDHPAPNASSLIRTSSRERQRDSRPWRRVDSSAEAWLMGLPRPDAERRLDSYAASLLQVTALLNRAYGFRARRVPAHMPHLIDRTVMARLQHRFAAEYEATSSHRFRSPTDMQFAYAYFYFLMSEEETVPVSELFDAFDTDRSGTWSDREIRTLMTRLFELPLSRANVASLEDSLVRCSTANFQYSPVTTRPLDRYIDSRLNVSTQPVVTRALVESCGGIAEVLERKLGRRCRYRYSVVRRGEREAAVGFHMVVGELSQLLATLDQIRRKPKKFICLNDNLDESRTSLEADTARSVLLDFYHSLLPTPSQFELDANYVNRFGHYAELVAWQRHRNRLAAMLSVLVVLMASLTAGCCFRAQVKGRG